MKLMQFKNFSLVLFLCFGITLYGEQFEFHNKTKSPVQVGLIVSSIPPATFTAKPVAAGAKISATINPTDKPQLLIWDKDNLSLYQLRSQPQKTIKLKLTTGLISKKTELEPQLLINNIKKDEIVLILNGMISK